LLRTPWRGQLRLPAIDKAYASAISKKSPDLSGPVIMEFSVIAALGVVIVALGRIFETSV